MYRNNLELIKDEEKFCKRCIVQEGSFELLFRKENGADNEGVSCEEGETDRQIIDFRAQSESSSRESGPGHFTPWLDGEIRLEKNKTIHSRASVIEILKYV
jgi:hypothetical protein